MSYQVLARKYRPQRFADVVGQEHVTQTLMQAIEQNRIAHAYLFCGPRGTGKTTIARIFAKALNSTGGPKADFDVADPKCMEIAEGRSFDVLEIDGASNNGVEQVRELRETCKYAPASSRFKIYIIDEVHMLSTAAFNALLKTLEEPPAHVKFMFATTDPEKVLPTILSRCQRFDLRRIPSSLIVKQLTEIAKKEKVKIDDAALFAIARGADGGMRDAESTLDQLISFCGEKIEESDVLTMFGLTAEDQILSLSRAVLDGEIHSALHQLNALAQNGKDLGRLLSDLLSHFRNLLLYQVSRGDLSILEVSEAEVVALKDQAALATANSLSRVLEVLADAELRLREAVSKKILFEVTLLRAIEARNAMSIDSVLKQLNELRGRSNRPGAEKESPAKTRASASAIAATPIHPSVTATVPEPQPPGRITSTTDAPAETPGVPDELERLWTQLLEGVGRASRFAYTYLVQAHPVSFGNGLLTIGFDPEFEDQLGLADTSRNHELLQTKLAELGHGGCQVKFIKSDAAPNRTATRPEQTSASPDSGQTRKPVVATAKSLDSPPAPSRKESDAPLSQEDFKNDPLIKKALETFKGQIVQVRT